MSQQVLQQPILIPSDEPALRGFLSSLNTYTPALLAISASLVLIAARLGLGGERFMSDGAAMMLALACYLTAAVFYLTNLYAPFRFAEKLGMQAATLGVFFNLSSWLLRWAATYDRELAIFQSQGQSAADMPWLFRYVPFANLYDLSLAFAFGAGITTLLIMLRGNFQIVAALSLTFYLQSRKTSFI